VNENSKMIYHMSAQWIVCRGIHYVGWKKCAQKYWNESNTL